MDLTLTAPGARLRLTGTFVPAPVPAHATACSGLPSGGAALSLDGDAVTGAVGIAEETPLAVWLEADAPVALRHADPITVADLRFEQGGRIVAGRIGLGSHVGRTRFEVTGADGVLASLEIDVVPRKATPREVDAMRSGVERAWAGAAFAAVRPTTAAVGLGPDAPRADPAWLAVLDAVLPDLARSLAGVARQPLREVSREAALQPTASLGRLRPADAARLAAQSGPDPEAWPLRVLAPSSRETTDTPALRWAAARIAAAATRAATLASAERHRTPTARRLELIDRLDAHALRLRRLRRAEPLARLSGRAPSVPPLALRRRPAHRRLYDALRALDAGLDLADGDLRPALRDLATLYEAWCALAVAQGAAAALGVAPPALPVARLGTDVALRRGGAVEMQADGIRLRLQVQPRFGGAPALLVQRPDLVLTAIGPGGTHRVALDAKYRRDGSDGALRRFGSPAPPADAIGTLHRYRDAVRGPAGEPGWLHAAVALYPWRGDAGTLVDSIGRLGVGAIPVLPGATAALDRWLGALVERVR